MRHGCASYIGRADDEETVTELGHYMLLNTANEAFDAWAAYHQTKPARPTAGARGTRRCACSCPGLLGDARADREFAGWHVRCRWQGRRGGCTAAVGTAVQGRVFDEPTDVKP